MRAMVVMGSVVAAGATAGVAINVPVSPAEKYALESPADGWELLQKHALKTYPDIKAVRVPKMPGVVPGDTETVRLNRQYFQIGLFFAKQIKLADGQTLFNFMTRCSGGMDAANGASIGFDKQKPYIHLQFFPKLRRAHSGEPTELNLIFRRDGATIRPESEFFSTNILTDQNYLQRHDVKCR